MELKWLQTWNFPASENLIWYFLLHTKNWFAEAQTVRLIEAAISSGASNLTSNYLIIWIANTVVKGDRWKGSLKM